MRANFTMYDQYITMIKGDTLQFAIKATDQDGELIIFDEALFTVKKNHADESNILQKSLDNGISLVDNNHYAVRIAPEDTENVEAGLYFYDLKVKVEPDVFTLMHGVLEIDQTVSQMEVES